MAKETLTRKEVRCELCPECIKINGKMCCHELWDKPCNDIENGDCPLDITIEEVETINNTKIKVEHDTGKTVKAETKPRTHKNSDEKIALYEFVLNALNTEYGAENVTVLKNQKLIQIKINDKILKVDLIQQTKKK